MNIRAVVLDFATVARRVLQFLFGWITWPSIACWFLGGTFVVVYMNTRPTGHTMTLYEDDGVAVVGGKLTLVVDRVQERFCETKTQRWLYRDAAIRGEVMPVFVNLGAVPSPPIPLGRTRYALELTLPIDIEPGSYHYTSRTDYDCGLIGSYFNPPPVRSMDVDIDVVAGHKVVMTAPGNVPIPPLIPTPER